MIRTAAWSVLNGIQCEDAPWLRAHARALLCGDASPAPPSKLLRQLMHEEDHRFHKARARLAASFRFGGNLFVGDDDVRWKRHRSLRCPLRADGLLETIRLGFEHEAFFENGVVRARRDS